MLLSLFRYAVKMVLTLVLLSASLLADPISKNSISSVGHHIEKGQVIGHSYGRPYLHNHTPEEYQSTAQNWCAIQDERGIMYFGNNRGILEYDGVSWRSIPVDNNSIVRSMGIDENGRIYVGAFGEFGFLRPDSLSGLTYESLTHLLPEKLTDLEDIWSIQVDQNTVYFQSARYVLRLQDNKIKTWKTENSYHRSFMIDSKFYLNIDGIGLVVLENDQFKPISGGEIFKDDFISSMFSISGGKILIGTRRNGLYVFDPGNTAGSNNNAKSIHKFQSNYSPTLSQYRIYHGLKLTNEVYAFATLLNGVIVIDNEGNLIQALNKKNGLQGDNALFLYMDSDNSLWVTLGNGISHIEIFSPVGFFGEIDNLNEAVYGIVQHDNVLMTATNGGIFYLDEKTSISPTFKKIPGVNTQSWCFLNFETISKDKIIGDRKQLLAGTNDGIIQILETNDGYKVKNIHSRHFVFKLHQSTKDPTRLYAGLKDGVAILRYANGNWHFMEKIAGISEKILSLAEDSDGNLWLGSNYSGIIRVDKDYFNSNKTDNNLRFYNQKNGLPSTNWNHVYFIDKQLLIASINGVYHYDEGIDRFKMHKEISDAFGAGSRWIYQMDADDNGNIWYDSNKGKGALLKQKNNQYSLFEDALKIIKVSTENEISVYSGSDSVVWFGSPNGLVRFKYNGRNSSNGVFKTVIRRVRFSNDSIYHHGTYASPNGLVSHIQPTAESPTIDYSDNSVAFNFSSTYYEHEDATEYQYFLEGFDDKWSSWISDSKKEFTNIPHGTYEFRVRARNVYGHIGDEARFSFEIAAPIYKTWWARLIYVILVLSSIFGYARWKTKKYVEQQRDLEKLVEHRTRQLKQKNDEISNQAKELLELNETLNFMNENLEIEVNKRTIDLAEKNQKLSEYAFNMAHKLRAPVSDILGLLQLFELSLPDNDEKEVKENLKYVSEKLDQVVIEMTKKLESDNISENE